MAGRIVMIGALVCYLAVVGCVLAPTGLETGSSLAIGSDETIATSRPALNAADLPYRGVTIQIQGVDKPSMDGYLKCIDEIAGLGADTVSIVFSSRQENGSSDKIYLDQRVTPSREQLLNLAGRAKADHLRVIFMPIVLLDNPRGTEWRGTIKPDVWEDWFGSYREMITHFAWIADQAHVDVLVVGSELVSSENKVDQWAKTIRDVRKLYSGRLTYSSNWDHYTSIPFWDQLDLMGMNTYWTLGKDANGNVPVSEIVGNWQDVQKDLIPFSQKINRPIIFLEVGWCSLANAAKEPWDYTQGDVPINLTLQQRLYDGFFRAWQGNPQLGGFMFWEWPPTDGGPEDRGYTPKNKPAEKTLKEWLAKPWK